MKIKKSPLAVLVTALLSSSVLLASPSKWENADNIEAITTPNSPELFIDYDGYHQFVKLSGDGKTIVVSNIYDGNRLEFSSYILSGELFNKIQEIKADIYYAGDLPSLSENGDFIILREDLYKRGINDWDSINDDRLPHNNMRVRPLHVTGSGLVFIQIFEDITDDYGDIESINRRIELIDINTGNIIKHTNSISNSVYDLLRNITISSISSLPDYVRDFYLNLSPYLVDITSSSYDGSIFLSRIGHYFYDPLTDSFTDPELTNIESHLAHAHYKFVIQYGENWEKSKILTPIPFDTKEGESLILIDKEHFNSISPDGNIAILSGKDGSVYSSKDDYTVPTILPKQINGNPNLDKNAYLFTTNWDGSLIGGAIGTGLKSYDNLGNLTTDYRPVLWFGENWSKLRELPTLGGDVGLVTSMSYDGEVIAGMSTDKDGKYLVTLWRIAKKDDPTSPVLTANPEMTKQSIATVANDSFKALEFQRYGLISLLNGCDVEKGQGHYCVSLRTGLSGQGKSKDARVGFSSAYQLTDNLSIGLVLDHSVYNRLQSSYKNSSNNIGAGLYAQWKYKTENSEFYIRPAVSYNSYKVSVKRDTKAGVEYGEGKTRLTGLMYSLTLGQEFKLSEDKLGWFLGLRHSRGVQKGFTDSAVGFPIRYDDVEYKDTSLFAGVNVNKALTEKLSWISSLEVEQRVHQDNPSFRAENTHLGKVNLEHKMPKTALTFASGVEYKLNDTFRVSLMPSVSKANSSQLSWNVGLNFSGQF